MNYDLCINLNPAGVCSFNHTRSQETDYNNFVAVEI